MKYFAFLIFLMGGVDSWATIYNPNLNPVGEGEAFMANTGVAADSSAGSVYFNPGALGFLNENKLSFTGSYIGTNAQYGNYSQLDNTNLSGELNGYQSAPAFAAIILPYNGWVFGFSVLQVDGREIDAHLSWKTTNYTINSATTSQFYELWAGFSVAKKIDDDWSTGVSMYGIRNSQVTLSSSIIDTVVLPTPGADTAVFPTNKVDSAFYGLAFIGGVQYKANSDLLLGLKLRSPFIQFYGASNYYGASQTVGPLQETIVSEYGISTNYYFPFDFTLGAQYKLTRHIKILGDLGFQLPAIYETSDDPYIGKGINTAATLRGTVGAEFKLGEYQNLYLGTLYNPSTISSLSGTPTGTIQENFFGASAGIKFTGKIVTATLGGFYYWSFGSILQSNGNGALGDVQDRYFGALLSGTTHL